MKTESKKRLAEIIDNLSDVIEKCGGAGSGKPGPCPTGGGGNGKVRISASPVAVAHYLSTQAKAATEKARGGSPVDLAAAKEHAFLAERRSHRAGTSHREGENEDAKLFHGKAADHHRDAAKVHTQMSSDLKKSGHDVLSKGHDEAAKAHHSAAEAHLHAITEY